MFRKIVERSLRQWRSDGLTKPHPLYGSLPPKEPFRRGEARRMIALAALLSSLP